MSVKDLYKEFINEFNNQKTLKERMDFIGKTADLPIKLAKLITIFITAIAIIFAAIIFITQKSSPPITKTPSEIMQDLLIIDSDKRISSFITAAYTYDFFELAKFEKFKSSKDALREVDLLRQEGNALFINSLKKFSDATLDFELYKKKIVEQEWAAVRLKEQNERDALVASQKAIALAEEQRKKYEEEILAAQKVAILAEEKRKKEDEAAKIAESVRAEMARLEELRQFEIYKAKKAQEEKEAKVKIELEFEEAKKSSSIYMSEIKPLIPSKPPRKKIIRIKPTKPIIPPVKKGKCFVRNGLKYC